MARELVAVFERILLPIDVSEGATDVLGHAIDLAGRHDAELHLLHVADTSANSVLRVHTDIIDVIVEEGEKTVATAAERAKKHGVETVTEVLQGDPFQTIVDYAGQRDMDLIVMPTHGWQGLPRFLLGSVTERVVRRSDVPVLTVQTGDDFSIEYPYRNVLIPTDGSTCALAALETGIDIIKVEDASLHLLTVIAMASLGADVRSEIQTDMLEASAQTILEEASSFASDAGVQPAAEVVEYAPSIHKAILEFIDDQGIDLVVVGTHGRTGLDRYMLGSVTEHLVRTSPIPVLTVREKE